MSTSEGDTTLYIILGVVGALIGAPILVPLGIMALLLAVAFLPVTAIIVGVVGYVIYD